MPTFAYTARDMTGKQIAGPKPRSSEALLHLEIYKQRADVKSICHCHPPHATAFAVAREPIPQCVLPEVEVFLGDVPITKYETPGGQAFADTIRPYVDKTNVIILANHGTVSYGETLEQALNRECLEEIDTPVEMSFRRIVLVPWDTMISYTWKAVPLRENG